MNIIKSYVVKIDTADPSGGGLSTVYTDGISIDGDGSQANPVKIKDGYLGDAAFSDPSDFDAAGAASSALSSANSYTDTVANGKSDAFPTERPITGAHTLDATDLANINSGKYYILNSDGNTINIPLNATVPFPVGTFIGLKDFTTISIAGGGTLNGTNGTTILTPGVDLAIEYLGSDTWTLHNGLQASSIADFNAAALAAAPAETTTTIGALVNGATAKFTPIDADFLGLMDSAASSILKKLSWANVKATLKTYFDTLYESLSNKATGFGTLNNTLYPTVQAVATYVSTQTNGGYSDVAIVNQYAGVDPTGVTDSKTGLQAAMASGKKIIVFDGLYKTTDLLTLNTGQTVFLRGGTVVTLSGNVNTGNCLFLMADKSHILAESGARLTHVPTGTASYSGIRASSKYLWSIDGKLTIDGFGNQGIWIQGAGSGNNGFKNGFIRGVICQSNINNGFGGANGAGHGIRFDAGTEYVYIIDCELYENQGFGILNLGGANNPIINTKVIKNTLGGLRIIGHYTNNTDHFQVVGCQINHNDAVGTYNIWVSDVDTGVNFTGLSVYGGTLIKAENSVGISFNGCGLSISGNSYVSPGTDGDGIVAINGGHVIGSGTSIEGFKTNLVGGGQVIFSNVRECQLTASYSSDFSAGVNSWSDNGTTATGNIDSITDGTTSFSDTLRIAGDGNNSTHFISRATTLTIGNKYKIVVTLYILTANTNVDGIRLTDSGGLSLDFDYLRTGKWITVEKDFTALGTTLQLSLLDGSVNSFTAPVGDLVYISRVKVFQR